MPESADLHEDLHKSGGDRLSDLERDISTLNSLADRIRMVGFIFAMLLSGGILGAVTVRDLARDTSLRVGALENRVTQDESSLRATDVEIREMRSAISRLQVLMEQMVSQLGDMNRRMERSGSSWNMQIPSGSRGAQR
jgi:uncharacterized coiled-coil protein SlyX